ncbi:uncharacterized protein KZ484_019668 isoform 2-T2 [Pholidichthys leucotaenia]
MCPRVRAVLQAWCLWVFLSIVCASTDPESTIYAKVGGEVVLRPAAYLVTDPITSIFWKHGENIAADWNRGGDVEYFSQFKDRTVLNITTGEMTLKGLSLNDSGVYTPEINDIIKKKIHLIVISPVRVPTARHSCEGEIRCVLTCDGDTKEAEPITYTWKSADKVLSSEKVYEIDKEHSSNFKDFICVLKNRFSQEESHPMPNPLFASPEGTVKISTGVAVFIALMAAVFMVVFFHRWKAGMWFFEKSSMPWEPDFWRREERPSREAPESNGTTAPQQRGERDEETLMS